MRERDRERPQIGGADLLHESTHPPFPALQVLTSGEPFQIRHSHERLKVGSLNPWALWALLGGRQVSVETAVAQGTWEGSTLPLSSAQKSHHPFLPLTFLFDENVPVSSETCAFSLVYGEGLFPDKHPGLGV